MRNSQCSAFHCDPFFFSAALRALLFCLDCHRIWMKNETNKNKTVWNHRPNWLWTGWTVPEFCFRFFFLFANSILDTIDHVLCARARDRAIDARREWCWNKFHFNHIRKNAHRTSNRQTFCFNMINVPWPFAFVSMMDERLERKVAKSFWKWNSNSIEIEILTFEYALVCYAHERGAFWRELSLRLHHYEDSRWCVEFEARNTRAIQLSYSSNSCLA